MFLLHEIDEKEIFDLSNLNIDIPLTQTNQYGQWQKRSGRFVKSFSILKGDEVVGYFQCIKFPLIFKENYLYIPYGPVITNYSDELISFLNGELKKIAQKENCVFIRLDFTPKIPYVLAKKFFYTAARYTYHSVFFQPRQEWFLKLDIPENDVLMEMHEKTRYSIRLAEKKGVVSEIINKNFNEYFEEFYVLMLETSSRNGFHLHTKDYYKYVFESLHTDNAFLAIAKLGDKVLVVHLIIVVGKTAHFIFGGSSSDSRNLNPAALAHWAGIRHAQKIACLHYNFGGISSGNKRYKGWDGLTQFKMKFGGAIYEHSEFYDIVVKPSYYFLYNLRKFFKHYMHI